MPRRHRGLRLPPGVVLHTHDDDERIPTVWRDGIATTAPARSIVDAADELQPEQLVMAIRQGLSRGLLTRRQLEEEAGRRRRHHRLIDRALEAAER